MKDILKEAFKPTPERFRYAVRDAVAEAASQSPARRKRLNKGLKIAIASVLVAVLIPTAVFGASRLFGIFAQREGEHGLSLGAQSTEAAQDYPEYVKMHIDTPEGFGEVPAFGGTKFYNLSTEEKYTDGFTVIPIRYADSDQKSYIANVSSYEERIIGGHQAYEVTVNNGKGSWNGLYVYFEDVNVMLDIHYKDVTEQQLEDFVGGISFTEGTYDDHTYLYEPYDERQDYGISYKYDESFIEPPLDTKLTFKDYSTLNGDESLRYTAQISDIRVTDDIEGLDESCFNNLYSPDVIADSSGKLLPREFRTFREGDGFNSGYEELSTEQKAQKMVIAEIEYENLSDEDIELFIPYGLSVMNKDGNNSFTHAESIDLDSRTFSSECGDTEITYLSPHGEDKSFYITTLNANEKLTVTVGFRCNADILDKAYLTINVIRQIVEPTYDGTGDYATYLFKVTDNVR